MKERPMLMSAPMVRAILAGNKTQTRRVAKGVNFVSSGGAPLNFTDDDIKAVSCPYGRPGDRLWVREAWMPDPPCDGTWGYTAWAGSRLGQIAAVPERFQHPAFCNYRASWLHGTDGLRWTPGIHMPRWASRITLETTGVRVERLQDISETDALAEGAREWASEQDTPVCDIPAGETHLIYRQLWEQINGAGSWDANPWVWVVEFKRVTP